MFSVDVNIKYYGMAQVFTIVKDILLFEWIKITWEKNY